jgi:hypothetical protein
MAQRAARSAAEILSSPAAAPVASKSLAEAQQRARYFFREVRARSSACRAGRSVWSAPRFVPARASLRTRLPPRLRAPGRLLAAVAPYPTRPPCACAPGSRPERAAPHFIRC